MAVIDDLNELADAVKACDHSDPAVQTMHDLAWKLVWRHQALLGVSDAQLLALGSGGTAARGGGTDKTKPPSE